MTLCDKYSSRAVPQVIRSKQVKICAVLIISFGIIAVLVSFLLPMYRGLACLSGLTILCNTIIPIAPHEPVILLYGKLYPPWIVAICAGIAISVIEFVNYQILMFMINLRKIRRFREKQSYQRAEHYFSKFPFLSLLFACLTPVPFIPFRVLAVTTGYPARKYVLSVFIGRTPRFYLLAWIGIALNLPFWVYVIVLVIAFIAILTKKLACNTGR